MSGESIHCCAGEREVVAPVTREVVASAMRDVVAPERREVVTLERWEVDALTRRDLVAPASRCLGGQEGAGESEFISSLSLILN